MKTIKISPEIHEQVKMFCVKHPETISEFTDAALLMRLDFLRKARIAQKSNKPKK